MKSAVQVNVAGATRRGLKGTTAFGGTRTTPGGATKTPKDRTLTIEQQQQRLLDKANRADAVNDVDEGDLGEDEYYDEEGEGEYDEEVDEVTKAK